MTEIAKDGGNAFPRRATGDGGMTLRDYFAAKAMQGMVTRGAYMGIDENIAHWAYAQADAMLEARVQPLSRSEEK